MIRFIVWIIAYFISACGFSLLYYKFTQSTRKINFKIVLFFCFGVIVGASFEYFNFLFLKSTFYFLFFPILFYLLNPLSFRKIFFYLLCIWFYGIILDLILLLILSIISAFLNFNIYQTYETFISQLLSFLIGIVLSLMSYSKILGKFTNNIYKKTANIRYINVILVIMSVFTLVTAFIMLFNIKNININFLLSMSFILLVFSLILLIKYKINESENLKYLRSLKENNDFYIKMDDENRIFKHNLLAKLLSIKSVSNKKAVALIDDLIKQFSKNIDFSNQMKIIPYGLNGIIYQKLHPYRNKLKMFISNEIEYDLFEILKARKYNVLVEKIIVVLDNAIEAALVSDLKMLAINIFEKNETLVVEVRNSFSNNIDIDKIGNKAYSTKGKGHGLGLFSILRNNEVSLKINVFNNYFITSIFVQKY